MSANLALSFDFYPIAAAQESYYEQGTAQTVPPTSPTMSAVGTLGSPLNGNRNCSQPGPYVESSTTRYQVLYDETGLKLRAYKSTDNGTTWTEKDAAHAPAVNNNAAAPTYYSMFASARDSNAAVKKIYCAFWDTDNTVSAITFNMATDLWTAVTKSTLAFLSNNVTIDDFEFTGVFRSSDGSLIIALNVDSVNIPTKGDFDRVAYAKFNTGTLTWDAGWTPMGSTDVTQQLSWFTTGAVIDDTGNVHFQMNANANGAHPSFIYHQVLHADNSLSVPDVVTFGTLSLFQMIGRPTARAIPGGGTELIFLSGTSSGGHRQVYANRATAGDAPAWSQESITGDIVGQDFYGCQLVDAGGGMLQGVLIQGGLAGANPANWFYLSNTAPGAGWAISAAFATTTVRQTPGLSFLSVMLAAGPAPPPPPVVTPAITRNPGGGPNGGSGCVAYHVFDAGPADVEICQKARLWNYIRNHGGIKSVCQRKELKVPCYEYPPWIVMPKQGEKLNKMFAIPLIQISGGAPYNGDDTLMGQFVVPTGWDGALNRVVVHVENVMGFQDFVGSIVWRIQVGQRFVKSLGNITNTFGSFENAFTVPGTMNIRLVSGQTVTLWVSIPNGSPVANGLATAGAFGWFYPRT